MQRTNIYLDDRQTSSLSRVARAQGISRAELVRRLIDRGLGEADGDLDSDLAAIEASFGVLGVDEGMPVRGPDQRGRHLDQLRRR